MLQARRETSPGVQKALDLLQQANNCATIEEGGILVDGTGDYAASDGLLHSAVEPWAERRGHHQRRKHNVCEALRKPPSGSGLDDANDEVRSGARLVSDLMRARERVPDGTRLSASQSAG